MFGFIPIHFILFLLLGSGSLSFILLECSSNRGTIIYTLSIVFGLIQFLLTHVYAYKSVDFTVTQCTKYMCTRTPVELSIFIFHSMLCGWFRVFVLMEISQHDERTHTCSRARIHRVHVTVDEWIIYFCFCVNYQLKYRMGALNDDNYAFIAFNHSCLPCRRTMNGSRLW